jgi:hypothetical protein
VISPLLVVEVGGKIICDYPIRHESSSLRMPVRIAMNPGRMGTIHVSSLPYVYNVTNRQDHPAFGTAGLMIVLKAPHRDFDGG